MKTAARAFIDSNIFLYHLDTDDPIKAAAAAKVLAEHELQSVVSVQVLQETYSVATKKQKLAPQFVRDYIERLCRGTVIEPDRTMVLRAIDTSERCLISFYDAMIVEAAVAGHCSILITEDLNDGQVIRGVRIVNPFQ
ncbi:MAG TPA: PIN domain-containing protein [Fimbriimonas sp.]|nr:PIN domain-containing protein [Fimbriimonas sp.]